MDTDEWRCWQCGRYYYPKPPVLDPSLSLSGPESLAAEAAEEIIERSSRRRHRRGQWAMGDINTQIAANDRNEQRWWVKNQDLIRYLDQGLSVQEIAAQVGRGERRVKAVREQLRDLRAVSERERRVA